MKILIKIRRKAKISAEIPLSLLSTFADDKILLPNYHTDMSSYRLVAAVIIRRGQQYLLVKKPRPQHAWQFPQGGIDLGETVLRAAKRELAEECGSDLKVKISAEILGQYRYRFPANFQRHSASMIGAEVKFLAGTFVGGSVQVDGKEIVDFLWATKTEVQTRVDPTYWQVVQSWF